MKVEGITNLHKNDPQSSRKRFEPQKTGFNKWILSDTVHLEILLPNVGFPSSLSCSAAKKKYIDESSGMLLLSIGWGSPSLKDFDPPPKNSSTLKSYRAPIGKDRLPTTIFQGRTGKNFGGVFIILRIASLKVWQLQSK